MPPRIHHTALTVKNLDKTIDWYKKNFNAEVIERYKKHDMEIAHIKFGDVRIELFSGANTEALPENRKSLMGDLRVVGTKHICIETDDLDELRKKLASNGVEFATDTDTAGFGGRYAFVKDPDGILIELYQG